VITLPLLLLALPSVLIGYFCIEPMLFGDFFKDVIVVAEKHTAMAQLAEEFHGAAGMGWHAFSSLPFWLALAGVLSAAYCYLLNPRLPAWCQQHFGFLYRLLDHKYYLDRFNAIVFAGGAQRLGQWFSNRGERDLIDGLMVNGSARWVGWFSTVARGLQTGYIYHYAFTMIVAVALYLAYLLIKF
jgi:NADH-quinone oxidoreductase subunit L